MPDKVPLWIIKNTFGPYGSRMEPRPETMSPDLKICNTCQKQMFSFQEWSFCEGDYYCDNCIGDARQKSREKWNLKYGRAVPREAIGFEYMDTGAKGIPKTEADIPGGNLLENDYAFWIGNLERYTGGAKSLRATCRACGQEVFGDAARLGHKSTSTGFYTASLGCNKVLMLCYQQLLKLDLCMVCGLKCYGRQKWGVPLCCPNCIKHWKFDETETYENLEKAVMQFWKVPEVTVTETGGCTTSGSTSNLIQMSTPEERQE